MNFHLNVVEHTFQYYAIFTYDKHFTFQTECKLHKILQSVVLIKSSDQFGIHIKFLLLKLVFSSHLRAFIYIYTERESGQSKEMPLVIYLAFFAKVANLYYTILTAFTKYWPDIVAKFMSGTQETFI